MKKIYFLSNCGTCKRIIDELQLTQKGFDFQDIKEHPITPEQLDAMKEKAGSYEALFSRVAMKYRSMKLNEKQLTEQDYKELILQEYTFLKRPVILIDDQIFVGSAKGVIEAAKVLL